MRRVCWACAQAGDREHVGEGRVSATDNDAGTAAWTNEGLSSYLVCVVEGPEDAASATRGAIDIGMLAIETSTGHILHAQFRWAPGAPAMGVIVYSPY